jgi:hypothetical protein
VAVDARRPAFYALAPGGWRDYVTLLHLPYTAWHLSYVVAGAALAPAFLVSRLGPALVAFFLAVGIGAHALDELNGRPLGTRIPGRSLAVLAAVSIGGAVAVGAWGAATEEPWLAAFVAVGGFAVVAYNLELFGGRFHTDAMFALTWGAFPLLTAGFAMTGELTWPLAFGAAYAAATSLTQRILSTRVRDVRRNAVRIEGRVERRDGSVEPVTAAWLIAPGEAALRVLTVAVVATAVALVLLRTL